MNEILKKLTKLGKVQLGEINFRESVNFLYRDTNFRDEVENSWKRQNLSREK